MRELSTAGDGLPDDVLYKEVVVIGNGPSGISVSYQLSGHWADVKGANTHPDTMLAARLRSAPAARPLPLMPLDTLAEGLEGRSTNPIPLLMDSLLHPGADTGSNLPSMLEWNYYPERQIDHVVLGSGKVGGLWQGLDPSVVTLSPARWMALPSRPLDQEHSRNRASVPAVAEYYEDYVATTGIQRYFRNHSVVTSVRPIKVVGKMDSASVNGIPSSAAWCVCGYDTMKKEPFRYVCSNIILATGASDRPNSLEGPPRGLAGAIRTPQRMKSALDILERSKESGSGVPLPVLVMGSGLSAADAILRLQRAGLAVLHAYRGASTALRSLPPDLYPEYHKVYKMMKDGTSGVHPFYTALPDHSLLEILQDGRLFEDWDEDDVDVENLLTTRTVKMLNTKTRDTVEFQVCLCAILIGSKPNLSFLPDDYETNYITWNLDSESLKTEVFSKPKESFSNSRKEQSFEENLDKETSKKKLMPHPTEMCIKCSYKNRPRLQREIESRQNKSCFLRTQWHNLKYIVGQGLQKTVRQDDKVDEVKFNEKVSLVENGLTNGKRVLNYNPIGAENNLDELYGTVKNGRNCVKRKENDSSDDLKGSGLGLGVYPERPIDCRTNPVAIDKNSHAVVNAPVGMYALGPLTGDNFVRFIPGGALAIISDIWRKKKAEESGPDCNSI